MPQIIMISHASWVNAKKSGLLDNKNRQSHSDANPESYKSDDTPTWNGVPIDKLDSIQYQAYLDAQ